MPQCAVATCRNSHRKTKGRRVRYHRFPAEDDVRARWVSVCGRGVANGGPPAFNASTARVCSLHFSPNSYERDVEHELLGLPPRSRLKRGAVPDRAVPVTLPSLIGKRRPPRQRQQQVTKGGKRRTNQRRQPYQDYEDEEDYPEIDPNGFDILLALGLIPNKARQDGGCCPDLNRMHVMEGCSDKPAASLEEQAKTNGPVEEDTADEAKDPDAHVKTEVEAKDGATQTKDEEDARGDVGETNGVQAPVSEEIKNEKAPFDDAVPDEKATTGSSCEGSLDQEEKTENAAKQEESLPASPGERGDDESGGSGQEDKQSLVNRKHECSDSDSDTPSVAKKMKMTHGDLEERERTVSEYVEGAAGASLGEIQRCADKLQQEVDTLGAMARYKEHEWNNIIRLKKLKEEMLLRLQRKKQVMLIMMSNSGKDGDWDLASDLRFSDSSAVGEDLSNNKSRIDSSKFNSKVNVKSKSKGGEYTQGVSLLKNNRNHQSVMMVPIVSSSPGNIPTAFSSISSQSTNTNAATTLRVPDMSNRDRLSSKIHRPILPKPTPGGLISGSNNGNNGQNSVIGEGRQGPILDVRSIIADYRQRHPETVPRRGRRLKSSLSPTPNSHLPENLVSSTRVSGGGGILSMASMALGSGSHVRTGVIGSSSDINELNMLLNVVGEAARQDSSRPSSADSSRSGAQSQQQAEPGNSNSNISFKDVLVQFAKMSQSDRHEQHPPANHPSKPPPYPEVTLHPVLTSQSPPHQSPSSSLLHGILTKSSNMQQHQRNESNRPATFSPTLARLLTAPERVSNNITPHFHHNSGQVSISDLLSTSKQTRNEITITPVATNQPLKAKQEVLLVEEDQEDSADRLVIDEGGDGEGRSRGDDDDHGSGQEILAEDVPECQGCRQRTAQFVCAGCGNQWYCSRDCQVSAWDEHSEICSG